jgi:hypothetical protein
MTNLRSWLRPRFSLRLLLLGVTAFAIGFPIWWRWPYQEQIPTNAVDCVITWQRQWGGGRIGIMRTQVDAKAIHIETLRNDAWQKHGPCTYDDGEGKRSVGQYFDDERHGVWTYTRTDGKLETEVYDHGRLIDIPRPARHLTQEERDAPLLEHLRAWTSDESQGN